MEASQEKHEYFLARVQSEALFRNTALEEKVQRLKEDKARQE